MTLETFLLILHIVIAVLQIISLVLALLFGRSIRALIWKVRNLESERLWRP